MTISSANRKAGPYAGNDIAVAFPFAFKVFTAGDVYVVRANASGDETALTITADYTVSLNADQNANPGGTVTLLSPLATGNLLVISSRVVAMQGVHLTNAGGFYPEVIENALDKLTICVQQVIEKLQRAVVVPITSGDDPFSFLIAGLSEATAQAAAAAESAAASAASYDAFDDRYLGAKTIDPPLDNDGSALLEGAIYWNTETNRIRVYSSSSSWQDWGSLQALSADYGSVA